MRTEKGRQAVKQRRWRKSRADGATDGELEQYERVVNCNVGVIEYTTNLQTAGDMIDAKRTHEASATRS